MSNPYINLLVTQVLVVVLGLNKIRKESACGSALCYAVPRSVSRQ